MEKLKVIHTFHYSIKVSGEKHRGGTTIKTSATRMLLILLFMKKNKLHRAKVKFNHACGKQLRKVCCFFEAGFGQEKSSASMEGWRFFPYLCFTYERDLASDATSRCTRIGLFRNYIVL